MSLRNEDCAGTAIDAAGIEPHRKAYLEQLVLQGYSACSRRAYELIINRFCAEIGRYAHERRGVDGAVIEALQQTMLTGIPEYDVKWAKYRLGQFTDYLVDAGVLRLPDLPKKEPVVTDGLRAEYVNYLSHQRGMSEASIYDCMRYFERFMTFRFGDGFRDMSAITPDDIVSFLRQITARDPSHLRNLFKFLFWSGKTKSNLTNSIPRIPQRKRTNLPRYLKPDEIQRLVAAAYSDDATGRRNYAILLLLARLGLRAPEVVAIQLEDINWRAGEILIRGKGKLHDRMPLPAEVGEAIVNYIQNGRVGDSRALFVSDHAPHQAFKDAQIINYILHKAYMKTGLNPPQKGIGSHLLRHSLATALLGKGASLEEISHVLRHRSRVTTMIYAKCDIGALRSIAQVWPVEGGVR